MSGPFKRTREGAFRVRLEPELREQLRAVATELRSVSSRDASEDPAAARLYPAAHPDDPLENLEFEKIARDQLSSGREDDIATVERTADAEELTADELLSWMRVANDVRLVLGVRLDISQDDPPFEPEDSDHALAVLYLFLTWLVGNIVETIPA